MDDLDGLLFVDILDEAADAAGVAEVVFLRLLFAAPVAQDDVHPGVQERLLAQAGLQRLVVELRRVLENLRVRAEGDLRAALLPRRAAFLEARHGLAALEFLVIGDAVAVDLDLQPPGERVDHRGAHAVQPAGDLVPPPAELAARVQHGEDYRDGRDAGLMVDAHWNSAAVVVDADDIAGKNLDVDFIAVSRKRLVDRVVDDLIDQVVQAARARGPDIHARAFADGLHPLENLYLAFVVIFVCLCDLAEIQIQPSNVSSNAQRPASARHFFRYRAV